MNKICPCAPWLHATFSWKNKLTIKNVLFQLIINFPPKIFRPNFDPKYGYKMINKKCSRHQDRYQRESSCVTFWIRWLLQHIQASHPAKNKIKGHKQPTNQHTSPCYTQSSHPTKNKLICLLTPILWKKKACIFSKSTNFCLFRINEIKTSCPLSLATIHLSITMIHSKIYVLLWVLWGWWVGGDLWHECYT